MMIDITLVGYAILVLVFGVPVLLAAAVLVLK